MPQNPKKTLLHKLIQNVETNLEQLKKLMAENDDDDLKDLDIDSLVFDKPNVSQSDRGKIIEGVFNGQSMIGPDGREYTVPSNYAPKSKLVEGDVLKLTISPEGTFVYKQIQPIDRDRIMGTLVKDKETDEIKALVDKKLFKLLLASITYFKGDIGDQVVLLVPKNMASSWAAVENIIKK